MKLGKKEIKGLFATVSGVGTTNGDIINLWAKLIPQIGIITTKSIGLEPKQGNPEPIICQVNEKTFRNAVGLPNPGCKAFAEELKKIYPLSEGKFLLTSIFGKTTEELQIIAQTLAPYSDGLELNFSCPHAEEGYGSYIGSSKELTAKYTKAVKDVVDIPIVVKLTPNVQNIVEIAKAAEEAGADAISAINTYNPKKFLDKHTKQPILSHEIGGMSGKEIKKIGLKCVEEIAKNVSIPIIGMGGISSAFDVKDYLNAGASIVGIGSALAGMNTNTIVKYFNLLEEDIKYGSNKAQKLTLDKIIMNHSPFQIKRIEKIDKDLRIFYFDKGLNANPGQFVFTWIPGHQEKPFSIAYNDPLVLVVRKVGYHTSKLFELQEGDKVMIRGPYGNGIKFHKDAKVILVGGGTGAAPLYFLAKKLNHPKIFLGGKTKKQLILEEEFKKEGELFISTDDGSKGYKGYVTDHLRRYLHHCKNSDIYFFNCGPEKMMKAAFDIQKEHVPLTNIYCCIERVCSCGIGLCGKCDFDGKRICVDGPVIDGLELSQSKDFGNARRDKTSKKVYF